MSNQVCFICNSTSQNCQINFDRIKLQYSGYSLSIFIKKFLRNFVPNRNISDQKNSICELCFKTVNEYDELCVKAKKLEDNLHRLLVKSDELWVAAQNTEVELVEIHEIKPLIHM